MSTTNTNQKGEVKKDVRTVTLPQRYGSVHVRDDAGVEREFRGGETVPAPFVGQRSMRGLGLSLNQDK